MKTEGQRSWYSG